MSTELYLNTSPQRLARIAPEPFSGIMNIAGRALRSLNSVADTAGDVAQALNIGDPYSGAIMRQIELQREFLEVNMLTNAIRTKHEAKMSAVRNWRVA